MKLNPWDNRIELVKSRPISLLSAREKMPFEVTPFVLNLSRVDAPAKEREARSPERTEPDSTVREPRAPDTPRSEVRELPAPKVPEKLSIRLKERDHSSTGQ